MKNSLHNKILENIQKNNVKQKPRWQFVFKESLLWIGTGLSLALASFAAGSFIFQSANTMILPPSLQVWLGIIRILLIALFIILATYQVMRIGRGYKRTKRIYAVVGLLLIMIIGSLLFASRISGNIERGIGPQGLIQRAQNYWSNPVETGLLAGELIEITEEGYLLFDSLDGGTHIIDAQFISEQEELFVDFLRVKMVGYENTAIFYPCSLAPWEVHRSGQERHLEYDGLRDGNIRFGDNKELQNDFNNYFERKEEIVRTNQC
ncbi:MAG: hypothetical protein ACJAV6_000625 [Candidatus Paceibacteria bacterium]|jgi:hypothetical protein